MHNSIRARSRSRLLSSPPPRLSRLASRTTHVREDTPLARMSPSRSCAKVTRASSRARDTTTSSRASAGTSRPHACTTKKQQQHILQYPCSLRTNVPCFPTRWSAHDPPRPRRDTRHLARDTSFGAGRDSIESPPPSTTGRDARAGTIGTPCARCGPRRGRRPSRRLSRRRRPTSGTCRSEPSVARDRDRERREGRRGDARAR